MKRLFFALCPEQATRIACGQLAEAIQAAGKPVHLNNLHVTVLFLGQLDSLQQQAMMSAASQIKPAAMQLRFDHLAYWKKPAIVCLRARQTDTNLSSLVDQLSLAAVQNEIHIEKRPYLPHVTLLRKARLLPRIEFEPIIWHADSFCLLESRSTPHGVEYIELQRWGGGD